MRNKLYLALTCVSLPSVVDAAEPRPTLVVAIHVKPAARAQTLHLLAGRQTARLEAWRRNGILASYRLLFTRYADTGIWDVMEVLTFPDTAAQTRWDAIEQSGAGGLEPAVLANVESIETTPGDEIRAEHNADQGVHPAYLVVPYQPLIPVPEYLAYLDGYTIPQFEGWMKEGVLTGYQIEYSRYPADRAWQALILLRYHDDAALALREVTTKKVRAQLACVPTWKAFSDNKKAIRKEGVLAIADELGEGGQ